LSVLSSVPPEYSQSSGNPSAMRGGAGVSYKYVPAGFG
jgi:hypothetical protein